MFRIPNWRDYQGYQKRGPSWVKLHARLLREPAWLKLSVAGRATLPSLWIVASEQSQDGSFDDDIDLLARLISIDKKILQTVIPELISLKFIESDGFVAEIATETSGEKRREEKRQRREEGERTPAKIALEAEKAIEEQRLSENFEAIRSKGLDIQEVVDGLPRSSQRSPFSASGWLRGRGSGFPTSGPALTAFRLLNDALEAFLRAGGQPILSDNNRRTFDAADRVLARMQGRPLEIEG